MHLTLVDYSLWFGGFLIVLALLITMHKRRMRRTYPYFFFYVLLQVAFGPLLFLLNARSYRAYYYGYYVTLIVSEVASVLVFWDILRNTLSTRSRLRDLAALMFWSSVALVLATMILINFGRGHSDRSLQDWMLSAVSATRVAQCTLILLLFCFRKYLGISFSSMVYGIALGFGLFAATNMLVAGSIRFAGPSHMLLSEINSTAYLTASLIWLAYSMLGSDQSRVPRQADYFE
jgi:hypothetical protein